VVVEKIVVAAASALVHERANNAYTMTLCGKQLFCSGNDFEGLFRLPARTDSIILRSTRSARRLLTLVQNYCDERLIIMVDATVFKMPCINLVLASSPHCPLSAWILSAAQSSIAEETRIPMLVEGHIVIR
jgi:hypothetical protein